MIMPSRAGRVIHAPSSTPCIASDTVAADAETADERLAGACAVGTVGTGRGDPGVLARWTEIVTKGDAAGFARRLAWDGLSPDAAALALATPCGVRTAWSDDLRAVLLAADASARGPNAGARLVDACVMHAQARLRTHAGAAHAMVAPEAHAQLARALRERLQPLVARAGQHPGDRSPSDLCARAPVVARLAVTVCALWADATLEFLHRLSVDAADIARLFSTGATPGQVTAVRTQLSDPHNGGRSVIIATWASGVSVVYKPRPLGVDARFADLLEWARPRLGEMALRPLRVLPRAGYGWIECAHHAACPSTDAVARYYARCGVLVAIVYALNGTDFHHENLLASGEHPVLLDLEMLLGHRFTLVEELPAAGMAHPAARRSLVESVLNLWMLPEVRTGPFPQAVSVGALAEPRTHNAAVLDGRAVPAADHVEDIVRGFEAMYEVLRSGADELLGDGGILDALRSETVRLVVRNTSLYYSVLERAQRADHLASGVEFGLQLDVLSRTFLSMPARPPIWPLVAAERAALARLDVPLFAARVDSRDLPLPSGDVVADCFAESAYEVMRRRLNSLDAEDCARQAALVRASFEAAVRHDLLAPRCPSTATGVGRDDREREPLTREGALAAASAVAARLVAGALRVDDGALAWVGPVYLSASRRYAVQASTCGMFDGYGGLAVFLAALARVTGTDAHRASAIAALVPIRGRIAEYERLMAMRRGAELGVGFGPASAALAMAYVGTLLADDAVLSDARRLAAVVRPALIAQDDTGDLLSGSAGAVCALLALHAMLDEDSLLRAATACGRGLMARVPSDAALHSPYGAIEAGAAHGAAGAAYALARLGLATAGDEFLDAAARTVAAERRRMGDLARLALVEGASAWAHGATGIALARLGSGLRDADDHAEFDVLLALSRANMGAGDGSLCCGDAGRIELLLAAGARLCRPELTAEALRHGARLAERLAAPARRPARALEHGLFQGEAGMAYTLLRATAPEMLPSLLLVAGSPEHRTRASDGARTAPPPPASP